MTPDEPFRAAFDHLAARLSRDVARHLDSAVEELTATAEKLAVVADADHQEAVARAAREARAEAEARMRVSLQAADLGAVTRLVQSFRAIDAGQTLSDILDTLVTVAALETRRVALFLTGEAQFRSLRLAGFSAHVAATDEIDVSPDEAGMLTEAVVARATVATRSNTSARIPAFAELPPGRSAVAVPLVINDEVAAVLYADEGAEGEVARPSWPATIEVLTRHASRALEALTAQRLAKSLVERPGVHRPHLVTTPADTPFQSHATPGTPPAPRPEDNNATARRYP